ncbi:hypothetical protein A3770_03p19730 [Chloropicon primus]|uniref:Hemerythrin-like domain-containing protein n=1 Tax=Chloropicon primus TaxID=1764295 RepID=A0A5B8MIG8_9CHLO|nr:hypothetical protein A3770_03p19730 [Chloropicon primus]|mmetsp:Transcript_12784/g.35778  ORF Transcript_12784/g.35778 Transcript_12784/m.35778 type:complete len:285 (+) Transcript_12784:250-1104(+)|eukprot:QDZ19455.1 hypothetical protein A3770_03p19730 [Chloropicon primus]
MQMRKWSETYEKDQVCFVCVCVDGRPVEVAREFQQGYFEGSTVKNAYIDDYDDFPKFPTQLGCQGFVVIDAKGHFATLRSPSLNKVGHAAFQYVEAVLDQLIASPETNLGGEEERKEEEEAGGAKAVFVRNACSEAPQELDGEGCPSFELPSVGHEGMDAEHGELEDLMRAAAESRSAADIRSLLKSFAFHAKEEEELMSRSGFGSDGGVKLRMFSAISSHAEDHANIVEALEALIASADDEDLVGQTEVWAVCRRIVEHAVNFDSKYAGKLVEAKKRKQEAVA